MQVEAVKIKTFPVRMDEPFNNELEQALRHSTLKSKHAYILKAIAEKIERDRAV